MNRGALGKWTRRAAMIAAAGGLSAAVVRRVGEDIERLSASPRDRAAHRLHVTATPAMQAHLFRAIAHEYERRNPGLEIVLDVSQSDQPALLQHTLRAALVGALPDVSFQGYEFLRLLAAKGIALPLNARSERVARAIRLADGSTVGLGFTMSLPVLVYNMRLLEQAGEDASAFAPRAWSSVLEVARRIRRRHPDVLGIFSRYNPFIFQGVLGSLSGRLMNEAETALRFDDELGQQTFSLFRAFGVAGQARADMTRSQLRQAFANERIAMLVDSSSSVRGYESAATGSLRVGTARLPMSGPAPYLPTAGTAAVLTTKDPERADAAWRFMQFAVGPDAQQLIGAMSTYVPANLRALESAASGRVSTGFPALRGIHDSLAYASDLYAFPGDNSLQIDRTFENRLADVVTLRLTPEDALMKLEAEVSALLGEQLVSAAESTIR